MPAVVEAVLTGSTVKVVTLPERAVLTVAVAGAQSPNVRRMPDGALEGDPFGREVRAVCCVRCAAHAGVLRHTYSHSTFTKTHALGACML